MKRFLSMIVAVCAFLAASAQHPMVTLSHNGELSFFTNLTALNSAVKAASSGDTIFLAQGVHVLEDGVLEIETKRLSIVGTGYKSHISGEIKVKMANTTPDSNAPLFDGVKIEKLSFQTQVYTEHRYTGSSEIRRCFIKSLSYGAYAGKNITYDGCFIENGAFGGYGTVEVKNSKIRNTTGSGFADLVTVVNCHVDSAQYYPKTMISSILNSPDVVAYESSDKPTYRIYNSILKADVKDYSKATVETIDCLILDFDSFFDINMEKKDPANINWGKIKGLDGTEVGIHGGESPFSENPSVPTVDTAHSSVEYDAEGNKLKVSITVKAD